MLARGTQIGPFRITRPLGRGGSATVYAVRHEALGTEHALKLVHHATLDRRIATEGRMAVRVSSPYVLLPSAVMPLGGTVGLVMPLVPGCSLKELLEVRHLELDEALALFSGIVEGLEAIHEAGVVHRDLKPSNVLLDPQSGRVVPRICDFGIARLVESNDTQSGALLGTVAYAAPEQQRDASRVDSRADLWSLGVLFHEMVTGHRPGPAGIADTFPADVYAWLNQLLQPDPAQRCPSVAALIAQLGSPSRGGLSAELPLGVVVQRRFTMLNEITAPKPTLDDVPRAAVPRVRDRFFGRKADLERIAQATAAGSVVTVTGFGGVGKTRLVVHFVRQLGEAVPVYWCDLEGVRDEEGLTAAVAKALGMAPERRVDPVQVAFAIGQRGACFLALDNAEKVAASLRSLLKDWAEAAPSATFVVTSRVPTGTPAERCLPLEPLAVDDAVALFVDRAQSVDDRFDPASVPAESLTALVVALDAVPLAIELAAARIRTLTVQAIRDRLDERFRFLTSNQARPERQATLRATLDWSWSLLAAPEQEALAKLSTFEGDFSFDAIEAVLHVGTQTLDIVESLVRHSVVRTTASGRFSLLHTVRAYASVQLDTVGERKATEQRHGAFYAAVAKGARPGGERHRPEALTILDDESGNLVEACRRAIERDDMEVAVATLRGAWIPLQRQGRTGLAATLAASIIAKPLPSPEVEGAVLYIQGAALRVQGRFTDARPVLERACERASSSGSAQAEIRASIELGQVLTELAQRESALHAFETSRRIAAATTDAWWLARAELAMGSLASVEGRRQDAEKHFTAALAQAEQQGDMEALAQARLGYAIVQMGLGQLEDSRRQLEQARSHFRDYSATHEVPPVERQLGLVAILQGRLEDAEHHLRFALDETDRLGLMREHAKALASLGALRDEQNDFEGARTAVTAALQLHRRSGNLGQAGLVLTNLARLQVANNELERATQTFTEGLDMMAQAGILAPQAHSRVVFVELLIHLRRYDEARIQLGLAIPMLRQANSDLIGAIATARLGDLAALQASWGEAHEYWSAATDQLTELGAVRELAKILARQAQYEAEWNLASARETLARAEALAQAHNDASDGILERLLVEVRAVIAAREQA